MSEIGSWNRFQLTIGNKKMVSLKKLLFDECADDPRFSLQDAFPENHSRRGDTIYPKDSNGKWRFT
jgi:hypothetical protein